MFNGGSPNRVDLAGFDPSPVGGSFMGFRSYTRSHEEGINNQLQIDDPNREMTIFFYYTEYTQQFGPTSAPPPNEPTARVEFRLGVQSFRPLTTGQSIAFVDNLAATGGTQGTWEERRITFTPAAPRVHAARQLHLPPRSQRRRPRHLVVRRWPGGHLQRCAVCGTHAGTDP